MWVNSYVTVLILYFDIGWRFVIKCLNVTVYHITRNQKQACSKVSRRRVSNIIYVGRYQGYNLTSSTFYVYEIKVSNFSASTAREEESS